jgi:hypothetical protein
LTDINNFRQLALSFPGTEELLHFEKTSFRVKKKIWATVNLATRQACLKLSRLDQSVFCAFDKSIIYPANNKWGLHGWTIVELSKIKKAMLKDIAATAFETVATNKK